MQVPLHRTFPPWGTVLESPALVTLQKGKAFRRRGHQDNGCTVLGGRQPIPWSSKYPCRIDFARNNEVRPRGVSLGCFAEWYLLDWLSNC